MEPVLRLWLENDGSTGHLVNAAGAKIASGHVLPVQGVVDLIAAGKSGDRVCGDLYFEGTVV